MRKAGHGCGQVADAPVRSLLSSSARHPAANDGPVNEVGGWIGPVWMVVGEKVGRYLPITGIRIGLGWVPRKTVGGRQDMLVTDQHPGAAVVDIAHRPPGCSRGDRHAVPAIVGGDLRYIDPVVATAGPQRQLGCQDLGHQFPVGAGL